jgi:hypothetical protein
MSDDEELAELRAARAAAGGGLTLVSGMAKQITVTGLRRRLMAGLSLMCDADAAAGEAEGRAERPGGLPGQVRARARMGCDPGAGR